MIQNTSVAKHAALNVFKTLWKSLFLWQGTGNLKKKHKTHLCFYSFLLLVSRVHWCLTSISFNSFIGRLEGRASGPKCPSQVQIHELHRLKQTLPGCENNCGLQMKSLSLCCPLSHTIVYSFLTLLAGRLKKQTNCFTLVPPIYVFLQKQQCEIVQS